MKSSYVNYDWKHKVQILRDFPMNPKGLEIHKLPECDKHQGYLVYHFTEQQCDWLRFYTDKEEASAQFLLKKEAQRKKVIPENHEYHVTFGIENREQVMSTLYQTHYEHPFVQFAKQGDRWVMEKVNIE